MRDVQETGDIQYIASRLDILAHVGMMITKRTDNVRWGAADSLPTERSPVLSTHLRVTEECYQSPSLCTSGYENMHILVECTIARLSIHAQQKPELSSYFPPHSVLPNI